MDKAEKPEVALLFLDAPHFVMGCDFLGCIYGKVRRFVLAFIFRQKIDSIPESTSNENRGKASKLIGQKVQLFDGLCPVCKNTFTATRQQDEIAA